ncbi:aldo/keto reductase [Pseudoalteromonas mariniglutinosa]|uniref:aldo/keto reductase n=1 Tax=Pseudoalteromonas mariniglutinosa TaxID=206042 RepID=UPI00384FF52E
MKLALGTVQFGVDYGVSNTQGRPNQQEVNRILTLAHDEGISTLDTALGYGQSHHALASFADLNNYFSIVTKLPPFKKEQFNSTDVEHYINYIEQCFDDLNSRSLNGILFHQANDIDKKGVEPIIDYLADLKVNNRLAKTGVSLYSGAPINTISTHSSIDLVQIPFNAFDTYFKTTGALELFKKHHIAIHTRSSFLQGLLLMPLDQVADYFKPWKTQLEKFHCLAKYLNVSSLTLCLSYVLQEPQIDQIIVGVNTERELNEILTAYHLSLQLPFNELKSFAVNSPQLTNPALWKY